MKNLLKKHSHSPPDPTEPTSQKDTADISSRHQDTVKPDWSFKKINMADMMEAPRRRRWWLIPIGFFLILIILLIVAGVAIALPAKAAYSKGLELQAKAKELAAELKTQNLEGAKAKLPETRKKLDETKDAWNKVFLLKVLPILSQYHQDVLHGLNAGGYGLDALDITIQTVEPYSDLLGLKGKSSFVS
jgi:Tfp pilus assembly protein PilO